jgi:hypothetical protein
MTAAAHRDSPETAPESSWSVVAKWLLGLALIVLVPVVLVTLVAGIFAWGYWREQRVAAAAVEREVARLQAAGQPMSAQELYAYHRVPDGLPDTTSAWLAAQQSFDPKQFSADGKGLPFVGDGNRELFRPGQVGSELASAEHFLTAYDATLQAILAAAKQPGECRHPVKFEDGVSALARSSQEMRTLVRLLALNLRVQACRGNTDGAVESLDAIFAASDTLAHQLTSVEQLVRMATLSTALTETEILLNEVELTDEQLAHLAARIAACDVQASFAEGLLGERALGYLSQQQLPGLPFAADRLKYMELMSQTIAASREPFPEGRQHFQRIKSQLTAEQAAAGALEKQKHMLTALILPSLTASFDAVARTLAYQRAVVTAIAAQRYRLKTGQFPAQLADLVPDYLPAVPQDPFDGQPLRMLTRDGELIIYSVGKDGQDDAAQNPPGNSAEPDVVVRIQ